MTITTMTILTFPGAMGLFMAITMLAGINMVLDQDSLVPLGVFVGGVIVVSTVTWKAGAKAQLIFSRIERLEDDVIEMKGYLKGERPRRPHNTKSSDDNRKE